MKVVLTSLFFAKDPQIQQKTRNEFQILFIFRIFGTAHGQDQVFPVLPTNVTYEKRETANDSTSFIRQFGPSESESSGKIDIYFG